MKKVVNSVLASALALTVAPMVVGAEEAQAPKMDAALEKVVKRLEALGLVAGYGNGEYGVDRTITRAEFATLIVRARGLEQGAKLAQFQSNFTDVKTSDWFAGFVNVASGQEIVKGFPDKSFKPQNQVTYAEAVAMIIRALGYEPAVKGVWPNNYIAKASELNIAKNITSPNNAATRGDVFKMLDNALRVKLMEQIEYGTDIRFNVTDETLLTKYLDVTVRDMEWAHDQENDSDELPFVANVPIVGLGTLKANEVTLFGKDAGLGNTTYKVADGIDPNQFAGQHVQVWIKDDKENTIVWMEGSEDEEVLNARLDTFYFNKKTTTDGAGLTDDDDLTKLEVKLDNGKTYDFAKDVKVTFNFTPQRDAVDGLKEIIKANDGFTFFAKVVLNDEGEISYIHVIDDQSFNTKSSEKYGSKTIEKVDANKLKITNLDEGTFDLDDKEEGKDFLVFINNKPAKFADLQPMDVYSVYYAGGKKDKPLIFATRNVVEGKVDKVVINHNGDNRLKIGDTSYRIRKNATYSDNANKDVTVIDGTNWDLVRDLDGEEVKLYLDAAGRVRHVETKDNVNDRRFKAIITKEVVYDNKEDKYNFTVLSEKGKKVNISIDADDIEDEKGNDLDEDFIESNFVPSTDEDGILLLEVTLDKDGNAEKVKVLDTKLTKLEDNDWDNAADEDDEALNIGKKSYEITSDTAIFDMTGGIKGTKRLELDDPGIAKFKDIADEDDLTVYYTLDGNDVEAIFVVGGKGVGSDTKYGYVLNLGRSGDGDITVLTKDGDQVKEVTYKLDGDADDLVDRGIEYYDFISFSLNGEGEVIIDDVVEVVNGALDTPEEVTLMDQDSLEDADLDRLTVARVDEVENGKITYKVEKDGKTVEHEYLTSSNTVYIDAENQEVVDGVDEGDYVVLVETDDAGSKFDYVIIVATEDRVDKEDLEDLLAEKFLTQSDEDESDEPGNGGEPGELTLSDLSGTEEVKLDKIASVYTITGKVSNPEATVTVTVGGKSEVAEVDEKGNFSVKIAYKPGYTEFTVVAEVEGEEPVEETGTIE